MRIFRPRFACYAGPPSLSVRDGPGAGADRSCRARLIQDAGMELAVLVSSYTTFRSGSARTQWVAVSLGRTHIRQRPFGHASRSQVATAGSTRSSISPLRRGWPNTFAPWFVLLAPSEVQLSRLHAPTISSCILGAAGAVDINKSPDSGVWGRSPGGRPQEAGAG